MKADINWLYYNLTKDNENDLTEIINRVKTAGLCVIPNFCSKAFCEKSIEAVESIIKLPEIKLWRDPTDSDTRIMGVESFYPEACLRKIPLINRIISNLYTFEPLHGFTMANRLIAKPGNLGSGQGWHRDSFHRQQFKALVYLSDVCIKNGPFEFVTSTFSRRSMQAAERLYAIDQFNSRLSDVQVQHLPRDRIVKVTAEAGALIIANTRAIHRGNPINTGVRYALTLYSWPHPIPQHIVNLVNCPQSPNNVYIKTSRSDIEQS